MANKKFNAWIDKNFKGLSVKTLIELVIMACPGLPMDYVDDMICVELFQYFTGIKSDKNTNTYFACLQIVNECEWL